jgi:fatty acid desaturase
VILTFILIGGVKLFRRSELNTHTSSKDILTSKVYAPAYTIIDNKVYDVRDFVLDHPGGPIILTHVGRDGTDAFHTFHPDSSWETLANYYVGDIHPEDVINQDSKSSFLTDIRKLKDKYYKLGYFNADMGFYTYKCLSTLSIFALSVTILYNFSSNWFGIIPSAMVMGLFWQQCGWLSHDFLHHQVSDNRDINNAIGGLFFGAVCQGFSMSWWKDKHNTHHAAPNVYNEDPDIDTHPFLAWSEQAMELYADLNDQEMSSRMKKFMLTNQAIIYFPLLTFARLSWCTYSLWFCFSRGTLSNPNVIPINIEFSEKAALLTHWFITLSITVFMPSTWIQSLVFFIVCQASCGVLLASVFSLNHNGMAVISTEEADNMDFYTKQVITGRDVTPSHFIQWFCGGLNYQVEHHLFPALPRHSLPKVQADIEALCKKHGIPYHMTGFIDGTKEVLDRLQKIATNINDQI